MKPARVRENFKVNFTLSSRSHKRNVLLLGSMAAFILLWRLGASSLAPWDEAIYAEVSKEIAHGEGWLTLHWAYQPWFEKPPLLMWMTAALFRLFGISEFWARFVAAASGIGVVVTTYLLGAFAFGKRVGVLAALILLTCYHFVSFSRFGTMEVLLTLFAYLAIYGYLRLRDENDRWWYLIWLAVALALLTKGAGGLIAPLVVLSALILDQRVKSAIQSRHFWFGSLLAFMLLAPWHAIMYAWYGRVFLDEYIGYHVIARATRTLEGHPSSYLYYIGRLVDGFFPWALLLPFALIAGAKRAVKGDAFSRILVLMGILVFGLYTIVPTRRPWYIVPLYPAFAILVAAFIERFYESRRQRLIYQRIILFGTFVLIGMGAAYCALSLSLNQKQEEPLTSLARIAQSKSSSDREPLVLLNESEPLYAQVPLFYSDRPVRQAYISTRRGSEDAKRYLNYESLADITRDATRRIILPKNELVRLTSEYEIEILAEVDPLVYGTIRHKD
jgi:4-amino-4-deoxy-L-arabinose transferase-like glycosyltransferase